MDEARWNIRFPLAIDITMKISRSLRLNARTRDVSFEGILVAAPLPHIAPNTPVLIQFDCRNGPILATAVVVRTGPEGTALMFTEQNDEVADALALLMESELEHLQPRRAAPELP